MNIVDTIAAYVAVAVAVAMSAAWVGIYYESSPRAQRNAARVGLLAMFWPALAAYAAVVGFVKVWRVADWGAR